MTGTTVKIPRIVFITTGVDFMRYAGRYLQAEKSISSNSKSDEYDPIPYHLLCQSLELYLKSFIWLNDKLPREKFRSKYGHDLVKLWRHAKDRKISQFCKPTQLRDDVIELVGPYYKDRKFVYLDLSMSWDGIPALRKEKRSLPTLRRLCDQLRRSLKLPVLQASEHVEHNA